MASSRVVRLAALFQCVLFYYYAAAEEGDVNWEMISRRSRAVPRNSLLGGYQDFNGGNFSLYVGRVFFSNNIIPAMVYSRDDHWQASFALDETVKSGISGFEIAVADPWGTVRWVPALNGEVPRGAVRVGMAEGGHEVLYACRAYDDSLKDGASGVTVMGVGALRPSAKVCFTSIQGALKKYPTYEVLVNT